MEYSELAITALGAIGAWLANEWRKREADNFTRREENYKTLLSALASFHVGSSSEGRIEFLRQVQICWLYCPDEVIRKAYAFLNAVQDNFKGTQEQRDDAARELVAAIRKDMMPWYRRTDLRPKDFQLLRVK